MTRLNQCILFIQLSFILSCTGNSSNTGNSDNTNNGGSETPIPQPPNGNGNNTYEKIPTGFYEVYLNMPDDIKNPDYKSDYYVGNIGFFGKTGESSHGHSSEGKTINFEISKLIGTQLRAGIWDFNTLIPFSFVA